MSTGTTTPAPEMVLATSRYVRMSARKGRLVADLVRGKPVDDAQAILAYSTRAAAVPCARLSSRPSPTPTTTTASTRGSCVMPVTVDEGPTLRRYRPRAKGRATRINKRTCHITIGIAETERD